MRHTYVVTYDISDPRRLRAVFNTLRAYGDHLQLSVFHCQLTRRELAELRGRLVQAIHAREDQVLFVNLGPSRGRGRRSIGAIGRQYTHPERHAVVI